MALPAWPSSLPPLVAPVAAAKTEELVREPQSTEMEDGPGRSRPRALFIAVPRQMSLRMTRAQFVTFLSFLRGDLAQGARRFTAPVRASTGRLATKTCKITGKVTEEDLGPLSIVAFTVLIFDW